MIRILLADDHDVMRQGMRELLETQRGWEVCGEASNGRQAVELARKLKPDIVVLDIGMPEMNGLEATRQLRQALPKTEVLIFSMHDSEELVRDLLKAGARGYVLKSDAAHELLSAVESLSRHKPFLTSKVSETVLAAFLKATGGEAEEVRPADPLSEREREVVRLLAAGQSNKEVGVALGISVKTVETHRATIMRKLNLNSVVELVHYAIRMGMIKA